MRRSTFNIRNIFAGAVLLIALSSGAVLAQTDRVIVGGKTPLMASQVDAVIEFYEWAFATRFTPDERELFEAMTIQYHKQDPAGCIKDSDFLINALKTVKAKDPEKQEAMRKEFTESFVADLRKVDSATARLLLPVYERGLSGEDRPNVPSSNGAPDAGIVGHWVRRGGAGGFRDYTGKTHYNNSDMVILDLGADGSVKLVNEKETLSITQCKMSEKMELAGRYTVSGGAITMQFSGGRDVSTSTCEKARNFNKTLPAQSVTKPFVVKHLESISRPDAPLILCLDGDPDHDCFEKEK